jgi:hypothetical protein
LANRELSITTIALDVGFSETSEFTAAFHRLTQGRIAEARSLLQWVYDRFSDGFENADLKAARAYLDCWQ